MDEWVKFDKTSLPEKKNFIATYKYEKYYRCRLHAWKNSL